LPFFFFCWLKNSREINRLQIKEKFFYPTPFLFIENLVDIVKQAKGIPLLQMYYIRFITKKEWKR